MYTKPMPLEQTPATYIPVLQEAQENPDAFGVEIELEGQRVHTTYDLIRAFWEVHKDGSLRARNPGDECIEYVSRRPSTLDATSNALEILFKYLTQPQVKVYDSYRTSIHIHVNFAVNTFRIIYNFITLALIFDELFVSQNGEHRIGNNFCLRARDAMGQVKSLIDSLKNRHGVLSLEANARYSSINFASLAKFGTVEFRSLECTTHLGRVLHWLNTLNQLKQASFSFENPRDVISKFSQLGPIQFMTEVLGPFAHKYAAVDGAERMLHSGMRIAQDFAYASTWTDNGEPPPAAKVRKPAVAIQRERPNMWAPPRRRAEPDPAMQAALRAMHDAAVAAQPPPDWGNDAILRVNPVQEVPVDDDDDDDDFDEPLDEDDD